MAVMRALWTGETVSHSGQHYRVEHAKLFTVPDEPPPVLVSGFGPKSIELAAAIADGYVTTTFDSELIKVFRKRAGQAKLVQAGTQVCFGPDAEESRRTAHRLWPNEVLPGELAQVLPTPEHFQQAVAARHGGGCS